MKILVIDRDMLSTQLVRSRLEAMGHQVFEESVKNDAFVRLGREDFDLIFFDPAPLNNARPVVVGIRRAVRNYPYLVLMAHDKSLDEALQSGTNDILSKPLDATHLETITGNAARLTHLIGKVSDERTDFPSAGGVIAKSAFNQLFLSSLDRSDRYAERSYLLFIRIHDYEHMEAQNGRYVMDYVTARLSQALVRLRRQSDIIGQTDNGEFCLMLQRPLYEAEPVEAAGRIADMLSRVTELTPTPDIMIQIQVQLIDLPVGSSHVRHLLTFNSPTDVASEVVFE